MNKLLLILFALISFGQALGQDIIILKDEADTIYCTIVSDKIRFLEYRLFNSPDTQIYRIDNQDIDGYVLAKPSMTTEEKAIYDQAVISYNNVQAYKYNPGIYRNFEEFKTNSPGLPGSIIIDTTKGISESETSYKINEVYLQCSPDSILAFKDSWWGFSDGFYRYMLMPHNICDNKLCMLYSKGGHYVVNHVKMTVFKTAATVAAVLDPNLFAPAPSAKNVMSLHRYIVHSETGEIVDFDKAGLRKFNIDPVNELWLEYNEYMLMDEYQKSALMDYYRRK